MEMIDKKYTLSQNFIYCLKATAANYPKLILYCCLIIVVNCTIPVISTFLPKVVIDQVTTGKTVFSLIAVTGIFTGAWAVASGIQKYLDRLIYWHKFKMNTYFLKMITQKALTTDYCNQENEHFRNLQSESFISCNGNFSYYAQVYDAIVSFFSNILGFIAFLGILLGLNSFIILFIIATTGISFILNKRIVKWEDANTKEKISYMQKMKYITKVSGDIKAAKDIRIFNMVPWLNRIYQTNMAFLQKWYRRYTAKLFGVSVSDSLFSLIREGVTYAYLLSLVIGDKITVADFVLYFNVVTGFSVWLSSILGQFNNLNRLNMSINRFRSFIEYPERYRREDGVEIKDRLLPHKIELENVSFRYNNTQEDILKDINLVINPYEHLAVVGLNGAGKTTLVKLICGLIDPTEGRVLYDGVDIREYNRKEVYRLFGAIFQQFSILPVSIENIVAEDTMDNLDEDRVVSCLKQADLLGKIESLKDGLKTKYDKTMWDNGIDLSGGEKQKLLLARALYKNTPIVLLDEPTAALDPLSERKMYETYDELMKAKSTVFISHRLASTRFCDRILLLEGGKVLEEGSHDELLLRKGKYYELFETQAKYYREKKEY